MVSKKIPKNIDILVLVIFFRIRWLRCYGIIDKLRFWDHLGHGYTPRKPPKPEPVPLTLNDVTGVFIVWLFSIVALIVIFLGFMLVWSIVTPGKYSS